ncbi:hypothetical protein FD755_013202, partial [Muntiacus reevesi]
MAGGPRSCWGSFSALNSGQTQLSNFTKSLRNLLKEEKMEDHWPKEIHLWESDELLHTMKKIKQDSSFTSIYTHLWGNVLRVDDAAMAMESRLAECSILLRNHASEIFEWNRIISRTISHGKLKQYKAFLKKYHKEKKIMLSDEMETKKDIEGCNFPGFRTNELTQLPRHLNAERIYLFILKAHNFDGKVFKIWRTHFLSEASIALLHDCFWWWFLHKFKPDRESQDCLFDRISESYVSLFMSIPLSRKDTFFQVYPDCLAQAIYATFQEAFPESSNLFNDEFKEDLGNNIFLWLSGLPPQKGFWTHWKLKELSTTTIHGSKKMPSKSIKDMIARNQEHLSAYDFNLQVKLRTPSHMQPTKPKILDYLALHRSLLTLVLYLYDILFNYLHNGLTLSSVRIFAPNNYMYSLCFFFIFKNFFMKL